MGAGETPVLELNGLGRLGPRGLGFLLNLCEPRFSHLKIVDSRIIMQGCCKNEMRDFPGGAVVKNPLANAGDTGLSPGPGRSHIPWSN